MPLLLLLHASFVVSVPAIVVGVVSAATRRGGTSPFALLPAERRLRLATAFVAVAVGVGMVAAPGSPGHGASPSAALGLVEIAGFALLALGFGLPALREAGRTAASLLRAEEGDPRAETVRAASLRPRRVSDHLPRFAQAIPFVLVVVGLTLFSTRVIHPAAGDRRLLLPVGFALAGLVFVALHAAWMRDEAALPRAGHGGGAAGSDDRDRGAAVRRIFAQQVAMAGFFPVLALLVLDLDWASPLGPGLALAAGVLGGVVGVLGCASVLASSVSRDRLTAGARETWR
jgi:hypothetical protein